MNVLKEPDSRLWRTNFHMHATVVDLFSFPQKLMLRESAGCWQHLCCKHHGLVFIQEHFSFGVNSSSPARGPEDWRMSFRLKMSLTTAMATSGWRHLHVWFPLFCAWLFHLMFSNSPHSQRNVVWAEIKCFGICGGHLIPVIHALIYLPLTHMKSLNFAPTPMQWFPPPLSQAC